jgi:3-phenylpropionate/trans-cinnamate dioxygenase ferredoxin reductase component
MTDKVLIAGGGLAAQRCCETLRKHAFEGQISIIGDEEHRPYDRPPLSKGVLTGDRDRDSLSLRPADWYEDHSVELLLGERAVALDPGIKTITLASGSTLSYDSAVIATGSRPRPLPGTEHFANTHLLRTVEDATRLAAALERGTRLIIVGAGFIGLEVAATARQRGAEVIVLEAAPAALSRVLLPELGDWFVSLHRSEGVELMLSAHVARFGEGPGGAEWVQLTDGRRLECDALVVGIGIEPATEWLEGSGLETEGVRADAGGRTKASDVYVAGDAARIFNPLSEQYVRSEHWEAATRQGAQVARAILGLDPLPTTLPSFWTDQFGHRIQLIGDASKGEEVEITGDLETPEFTAIVSQSGVAVAGMAVDQPRSIPRLRQALEQSTVLLGARSTDEVPAPN